MLHYSKQASDIALEHSKYLKKHHSMNHNGAMERFRQIDGLGLKIGGGNAENCVKTWIKDYYNFTDMPEMTVYSWKESPGHDSNQLRPSANAAGMGVYCVPTHQKFHTVYECY
jgi:uncharacterized protein YkwD